MITTVFLIVVSIGLLYTLTTVVFSAFELKRVLLLRPENQLPPVSVLKPLKGVDDQLEKNLESFFRLDYPTYELLFGLSDADDPAVKIIYRLQKRYPKVESKLVIESTKIGLNPKVNNLENVYWRAKYNLLLISDSNVRVKKKYLKSMVSEYLNPGVGLVTSVFRGSLAHSIGSIFENLHLNSYIAPNVITVKKLFKKPITIGKSMLFSREVIDRIKGFSRFGEFLAEDHMLGLHIKKKGLKISQSNFIIDNVNINWSLGKFINRHLRWAKMRRTINIGHYLIEPLSNPIMIALIYLLINLDVTALILFFSTMMIKTLLDMFNLRLIQSDLRWYHSLLIPLKDLLVGFIWLIPFVDRKISWRGNIFRIEKGSRLVPITG